MKTASFTFTLIAIAFLSACKEDEGPITPAYVVGKNRFIVKVDGDDREYYVHVPAGYDSSLETPVVFMLHGTSGDGEEFYEKSGWKEVGEAENILTVYPSSWRYCIITGGEQKVTTKWNSIPAEWTFCSGETPRDDIKFFKSIIAELHSTFSIDNHRIYLVGFSNGSQMAGKCSVEMGDTFAAIVESAGSLFSITPGIQTFFPVRKLPVFFQKGNQDYGPGNTGPAAPLSLLPQLLTDSTLTLLDGVLFRHAVTNITNFGLDPNFTIAGDTNAILTATYTSASSDPLNVFNVSLIKGLKHAYPNGTSHPFKAAEANWTWLRQYRLP